VHFLALCGFFGGGFEKCNMQVMELETTTSKNLYVTFWFYERGICCSYSFTFFLLCGIVLLQSIKPFRCYNQTKQCYDIYVLVCQSVIGDTGNQIFGKPRPYRTCFIWTNMTRCSSEKTTRAMQSAAINDWLKRVYKGCTTYCLASSI
jgi:hypothetical protein